MWRVKKMCRDARFLCIKIESALATVLENMVKDDEMKDMYKGSTGFNNLTIDAARQLKNNLQSFKDNLENITVIMSASLAKAFKKAAVLAQQKELVMKGNVNNDAKRTVA